MKSWNKGLKNCQIPWNKDKKGVQKAWNKGLRKEGSIRWLREQKTTKTTI